MNGAQVAKIASQWLTIASRSDNYCVHVSTLPSTHDRPGRESGPHHRWVVRGDRRAMREGAAGFPAQAFGPDSATPSCRLVRGAAGRFPRWPASHRAAGAPPGSGASGLRPLDTRAAATPPPARVRLATPARAGEGGFRPADAVLAPRSGDWRGCSRRRRRQPAASSAGSAQRDVSAGTGALCLARPLAGLARRRTQLRFSHPRFKRWRRRGRGSAGYVAAAYRPPPETSRPAH